jgi:hypothetical protein
MRHISVYFPDSEELRSRRFVIVLATCRIAVEVDSWLSPTLS